MKLYIKQVGVLATWVDLGRKFAQVQGYCQSGAADYFHYMLANALCGNPLDQPAIEVLAGQFSFICDNDCYVSVSGAQAQISIDNQNVETNNVFYLKAGQCFSIKYLEKGLYNYIAFNADACLNSFKSSVCAVKKELKGGQNNDGRGIAANHVYQLNSARNQVKPIENINSTFKSLILRMPLLSLFLNKYFSDVLAIEICLCYQGHKFSNRNIATMLHNEYTINASSDKMGMRLDGPSIEYLEAKLQSQALALGAVQITGQGQAIIMRSERQTMGGYPVLGVVSKLSLALLSQASSGSKLTFELSDFATCSLATLKIRMALEKLSAEAKSLILRG